MPSRALRPTRRALLTGAAGTVAAAAAGCGPTGDAEQPGDSRRAAGDPSEPAADADSDLVERVTRDLAAAVALATAIGRALPPLRRLAGSLVTLHRRHGRELGGLPEPEPAQSPTGSAAARATLLAAEERLQRRLVAAAMAAESGALAQTLASMAAAVAQRRVIAS